MTGCTRVIYVIKLQEARKFQNDEPKSLTVRRNVRLPTKWRYTIIIVIVIIIIITVLVLYYTERPAVPRLCRT